MRMHVRSCVCYLELNESGLICKSWFPRRLYTVKNEVCIPC